MWWGGLSASAFILTVYRWGIRFMYKGLTIRWFVVVSGWGSIP